MKMPGRTQGRQKSILLGFGYESSNGEGQAVKDYFVDEVTLKLSLHQWKGIQAGGAVGASAEGLK